MLSTINSSSKTNEELLRVYSKVPNVSIQKKDNAVLDYYNRCITAPASDDCDVAKPLHPIQQQSKRLP